MANILIFIKEKGFWYSIAGSLVADRLKDYLETHSDMLSSASSVLLVAALIFGAIWLFDKYVIGFFRKRRPRKGDSRENVASSTNEQRSLEQRIAILEGKTERLDRKVSEVRQDVSEIGKMVGKNIVYIG